MSIPVPRSSRHIGTSGVRIGSVVCVCRGRPFPEEVDSTNLRRPNKKKGKSINLKNKRNCKGIVVKRDSSLFFSTFI